MPPRLELREQKVRLDKEFGEMLGKIADRKDRLLHMEKKLATLDRTRLSKEVRTANDRSCITIKTLLREYKVEGLTHLAGHMRHKRKCSPFFLLERVSTAIVNVDRVRSIGGNDKSHRGSFAAAGQFTCSSD